MFSIKNEDLNKPGFTMCVNKLQNFPGFSGKTARRVAKLCINAQAHWDDILKQMKSRAKELGGELKGRNFEFTDKENEMKFDEQCKELMQSVVELNCKKLQYAHDLEPYEKELKLTPLDWEVLAPFIDGTPD